MKKIYDRKFMKYIKETMLDMKAQGITHFAEELNNILSTKELTLLNIGSLLQFLQYRINNPEHYNKEFLVAIQQGLSSAQANKFIKNLKAEHNYMYKIISKYFTCQKHENGLVIITKLAEVA